MFDWESDCFLFVFDWEIDLLIFFVANQISGMEKPRCFGAVWFYICLCNAWCGRFSLRRWRYSGIRMESAIIHAVGCAKQTAV